MRRMPAYLTLPMLLVFAGALLSAAGAFFVNLREKQEKLESADDRIQFESELRSKSDKIADLSREIINLTTGGSSYAYVTLGFIPGDTDACSLAVQQAGKYPVHDVYVRIVDVTARLYSMGHYPRYQVTDDPKSDVAVVLAESIGTIGPGQKRTIGRLNLGLPKVIQPDDADEYRGRRDFRVEVTAKNGTVIQQFRFKKNEWAGEWSVATRRDHAGEIEEIIPDGFRDKNGGFEW